MRIWLLALCLCLVWLAPGRGAAQLTSNNYAIDLFTGPVIGASRIVGMGGAHGAIASGIDGSFYNPAGYAERVEKEIYLGVFDITGGLTLGGLFANSDVQNNGSEGLKGANVYQVMLGTRLQLANVGTGVSGNARVYTVKDNDGKSVADIRVRTIRVGAGYAFLDGDLVVGSAIAMINFNIAQHGSSLTHPGKTLVGFKGVGVELGALYRPAFERYRFGAAFRGPVSSEPQNQNQADIVDGVYQVEGFVLPSVVHVPWELDFGFAYQFGPRRANVPWRSTWELRRQFRREILAGTYQLPQAYGGRAYSPLPGELDKAVDAAVDNHRQSEWRYRRHQVRKYVLIATDLLLYGRTENGQSVSAFLLQHPEPSGLKVAYGARFGVESEVMQDRMKVRGGTYLEPSRVDRRYYRPHLTAGMDVRMFDFWRWSARGTLTVDLAPRYFNWGVAVGMWW